MIARIVDHWRQDVRWLGRPMALFIWIGIIGSVLVLPVLVYKELNRPPENCHPVSTSFTAALPEAYAGQVLRYDPTCESGMRWRNQ